MGLPAPSPSPSHTPGATPARVAGVYLLLSLAWIWLSDLAMTRLGFQGEPGFWVAAAKGSVFVVLCAGALYCLVRREVRALTRALDLLQAVTDGTTDAVFVKDSQGKYLLCNAAAARFVGKPVVEVLGKDDAELFDPASAAVVRERDRRVVETGRTETLEEELTAAGVTRTYLAMKAPYRDANGRILGTIGISRDITDRKRVESELRASEQRYRALVEHADALYLHDHNGIVLDVNEQACASLGYSRSELIGRSPVDFDSDVTAERLEERLKALDAGKSLVFDSHHLRKDGSAFPVEVRICSFTLGDRRFGLALVRDITERKKVEESLRASEERYRDLIELSPEGIAILHEGRFAYVNRPGAKVLGLEPATMIGRLHSEFIHPDDKEISHQRQSAVVRDSRTVPLRQFRLRHADGSWRVVESCAGPCRFEGKAAVQLIARDVTERIRAEQLLREHEEQLRTFVDNVWAPIAMLDRDMRYIHHSRRWLTDYRLGDRNIIGLSHYEVFPEVPERWKEIHRRCLAGAVEKCEEDRFERADGTVQWLRWEIQPWRRADGEVGGLAIFTEDVTARKRMEAQLQQSQRMEAVGRLAGGIAHDFNNLLTVINGYSDYAINDMSPGDPHRDAIAQVRSAGERAARLTQQLLAYSRKAMIELKVLDLNELVAESTTFLRPLIGEDVVLATALHPSLARVKVDRGQVEQILMNLVVNARDAMPGGGTVAIETRNVTLGQADLPDDPDLKPGAYAQLAVADTGTGMTKEVADRVFEPFFTTKGVGQGTGLGLAVVQGAVKQSGGHISVASEVGVGTTFTILLPAATRAAIPEAGAAKSPSRGTETILLVEDEDAVRAISRLGLESQGYKVLTAENGADAILLMEKHAGDIDLLVTDVVMPEMGGREIATRLRRRLPGLRVLYMSGYTDDVVVRHGLAESTADFLQKPFTPLVLATKVREVLDHAG